MESFELQDSFFTLSLIRSFSEFSFQKQILNENSFKAVFIDPKLIIDTFQVRVAVSAANNNLKQNKLITKDFSSEIILALSASKNIAKSQKLFNYQQGESILLLTIGKKISKEELEKLFHEHSFEMLSLQKLKANDIEEIKKVYKIKDKELKVSSLLNSIVSRIATNFV